MPDDAGPLSERLSTPVEGCYPLPRGETPDLWRERSLEALEVLRRDGGLSRRDAEGGALLATLRRVALDPVAPALEARPGRVRLLGELIRTLAEPGRINQGLKGTCAVTCVESWLAETAPAEYARIVAGLFAPDGTVKLQNGEPLVRDQSRLLWSEREAGRSPVSRMFQAAAMDYAYPGLDYRDTEDGFVDPAAVRPSAPDPPLASTGLDLDAFDRFVEGVTGERWDTLSEKASHIAALLAKAGLDVSKVPELRRDGLAIVARSAAGGSPTFVTLDVRGHPVCAGADALPPGVVVMPHKVRVVAVDEAAGRVVYDDPLDPPEPWLPGIETRVEDRSGRCSMTIAGLGELMLELSYRPCFWLAGTGS
jgi:hypothetical protein